MNETKPKPALQPKHQEPLCSVVIPSYNCLGYLKQALKSVQAQSLQAIEIIVVDDGSTDGTWQWLEQQQQSESRLVAIKGEGRGPARARNLGIAHSSTEIIALLDADDTWRPDKLSEQLSVHLSHPEMGFSFTDYRHIGENGEDRGTCFEYWPSFQQFVEARAGYRVVPSAAATIFAENVVGTSTVMFSKTAFNAVGGFDCELVSAEDWDLWLKLALHAPVAFLNRSHTHYLMRSDSESSKAEARLQALGEIYLRHQQAVAQQSRPALRVARSRIQTLQAELAEQQDQFKQAFSYRLRALFLNPHRRELKQTLSAMKLAWR
ncbi:glycosyltransferase family 2 protein [Aliagarivorans marinus]|uniref:glycosyltransferase family 2 protein n=1 Tax=Aliagarivorans marinus TaxID=561965 RepID=UPI0004139A86|nr:glycosyltransferase family 2 protein [Aliagarivorans marinus]